VDADPEHGRHSPKKGALEDSEAVEARIRQVTPYIRSERLAISPQCGFTSAEANKPLPVAE
jgi:methionine synthase II (cobalamin-independent)